MVHFIRGKKILTNIDGLAFVSFLGATGLSVVDTIWALYIFQFVQSDILVGLLSAFLSAVSLASFVLLIPFLQKHRFTRLYVSMLFLYAVVYGIFAYTQSFAVFVVVSTLLAILYVLRVDSFGMIVRYCGPMTQIGKSESLIYAVANAGWLVGPLVAAFVAEQYGYDLIFLLGAFFHLMAIVTFLLLRVRCRQPKPRRTTDGNFVKNLKEYFTNKELVKNYVLSGSPTLWWGFVYIYMPLYIVEQGLGLRWVALFLFAVIVPLIIVEYFSGAIADKHGYRMMFVLGHLSLVLLLVSAFFVQNIYVILLLVVLGSISVAFVEPTTEAHFFLVAPQRRTEKYYSIYNTTIDTFSGLGKLIVAGSLFLLPFRFAFLTLAVVYLLFTGVSLSAKEPRVKA